MTIPPIILRCGVCDRGMHSAQPVIFAPSGQPVAHEACMRCPLCQSTFTIMRGVDLSAGRMRAELRCFSCLHGWTTPNVVEAPTHG